MKNTFAFAAVAFAALLVVQQAAAQTPAPTSATQSCTVTGPAGNRIVLSGVACDRNRGAQVQGALGNSGAVSSQSTADGRVTQGGGETMFGGEGAWRRETGDNGVTSSRQSENAIGGAVSSTRTADGQSSASTTQRETAMGGRYRAQRQVGADGATVTREGTNALGGQAQASRTVTANGVSSTVSGRNFFGGSYSCTRTATYEAGRAGQVSCTGPGGVSYGGGTVAKVNPDGSVDLILRNARGEETLVTAVTVR